MLILEAGEENILMSQVNMTCAVIFCQYICYEKTMDLDYPWIDQVNAWMHTLIRQSMDCAMYMRWSLLYT